MVPEPDLDLRLKSQKSVINTDIAEGNALTYSVASLDKDQEIDCFYQIFQDDANNLIKASETPMREGNPSDTTYVYYFDKNGITFAFQVKVAVSDSIFNSITAYYDRSKNIIAKEFAKIDNCDIQLEESDSIYVNLSYLNLPYDVKTFVNEKKILLRNR